MPEQTTEQIVAELHKTNDELQKNIKSGQGAQAEYKAKLDEINAELDKREDANQKLLAKMAQSDKDTEEQKELIEALEAKMIKLGSSHGGGQDEHKSRIQSELKAATDWSRSGSLSGYTPEEQKSYLRSDVNTQGGFLMMDSFDDQIIKPVTEISELRPLVRVKRIDALSERFTLRSSNVTSTWEGEGVNGDNSQQGYSQPEIHAHKLTTSTKITQEALQASRFNMESEILSDFAEDREQKEGSSFVIGTGNKQPRGFINHPDVEAVKSGTSGDYDFDDLILLTGKLKKGYKPAYAMNRLELAYIRTLKDGADRYIWQAGNMGASVPSQINGDPYVILPDMPNRANGAKPIAYADWRKFYCIVDALQAVMMRNPYLTGNDIGKVEFSLLSWVGGDVILPEAGVLLETSA